MKTDYGNIYPNKNVGFYGQIGKSMTLTEEQWEKYGIHCTWVTVVYLANIKTGRVKDRVIVVYFNLLSKNILSHKYELHQ